MHCNTVQYLRSRATGWSSHLDSNFHGREVVQGVLSPHPLWAVPEAQPLCRGSRQLAMASRARTQHDRPRLERCPWGITFQACPDFSHGLGNSESFMLNSFQRMMLCLWLSAWELTRGFINVVSSYNFQVEENYNPVLYTWTYSKWDGIPICLRMFIFMPKTPSFFHLFLFWFFFHFFFGWSYLFFLERGVVEWKHRL